MNVQGAGFLSICTNRHPAPTHPQKRNKKTNPKKRTNAQYKCEYFFPVLITY